MYGTVEAGAEVWTFCLYMCGFMFVNTACPLLTTAAHMLALPEPLGVGEIRLLSQCVASKPHGHNQQPCVQCILCYQSRACTHGMVRVESWAPQSISNQHDTTPKCTHGVSGYLPAIAGTSCPLQRSVAHWCATTAPTAHTAFIAVAQRTMHTCICR